MAKKRTKNSKPKLGATTTRTEPKLVAAAPSERPVFWFGFELPWLELVVFRFVLFVMLAIDALMQIGHAPRYGAGGFNVAHLGLLDAIGPGRASFAIAELVMAYLLVMAAFGVATRVVLPIATVIYGWLYFGSQLDSYQHHYLVFLVLLIACFVPWRRPVGTALVTPVRAWAIRLLLVQLGIVYLWAAISKMSHAWTDGSTLGAQFTGSLRSAIDSTIGIKLASRVVLLTELALAVTVWIRRAWFVALPLGIAMHIGIIASDLEIGLFAFLMLGFYLLVVPDAAYRAIAKRLDGIVVPPGVAVLASAPVSAVLIAGGVALSLLVRFDYAFVIAVAMSLLALAGILVRMRAAAIASLAAMLLWVTVDRMSDIAVDYYRFWGGSQRRLGDLEQSEAAYRKLTKVVPGEPAGHFQLGKLLLARGDETGLDELHAAQALEPDRARAFVAEAQWLASKDRGMEAALKAKAALAAEPSDPAAQQLVQTLEKK